MFLTQGVALGCIIMPLQGRIDQSLRLGLVPASKLKKGVRGSGAPLKD